MRGILYNKGKGPKIRLHELGGIASGDYSYPVHPRDYKMLVELGLRKKSKREIPVIFGVIGEIKDQKAIVYSFIKSFDKIEIIRK